MNGLTYLVASIYPTRTQFSRLPKFLNKLQGQFEPLPFAYNPVIEKIQNLAAEFELPKPPSNQEEALTCLMARDLRLIERSAQIYRSEIESESDFEASLLDCRDQCVRLLKEIGLSISPPAVYIVDGFPKPFERSQATAMATDSFDEENYGIPQGIHFRRDLLRPIYSRFLLTHEIIHTILGQSSPEYMGRGLEEGLAEIVGSLYLSSSILGKDLTGTIFYHNRLGYGISQFWQLYLDYARMGTYLYHRFGMDGLVDMLNGGRKKIKEIEALCFQGKFQEIRLPAGRWLDEVDDLANFLMLVFSRDFVISPLAFYVADFIAEGDTIEDVAKKSGLDRQMVKLIIGELQDRLFLLLSNEERVDISDVQMLMSAKAMRYEI